MPIFDAHIHADTRGWEDLRTLSLFGTRAVVTCAHDFLEFSGPQSVLDHYQRILDFDCRRLRMNHIRPFVALGIHPSGIPREGVEEVLARLPEWLIRESVVAVGEIGLQHGSEQELEVFRRQLQLAKDLGKPCVVHTPEKNKAEIARLVMEVISQVAISLDQVVIDHVDTRIADAVRGFGSWMGLSVQPFKISDKEAASLVQAYGSDRVMLDSDLASGVSDVLSIPKAIFEMKSAGISAEEIRKVTYENAASFYRVGHLLSET
ncbi:MAG TPA: TatD family hydrolase [Dehalococcoidia bacterium]|nr:TatD family hydrolase [Dehalococcoidia bacterium]HLE82286.1 TatD family hydrolase [Dehalococcoidia bacterium]